MLDTIASDALSNLPGSAEPNYNGCVLRLANWLICYIYSCFVFHPIGATAT
jgi:hypothetical protein